MSQQIKPAATPERIRLRLRELLEQDGRTQAVIAELAGMQPAQLNNILSGNKANPEVTTIARILDALGKDWSEFSKKFTQGY